MIQDNFIKTKLNSKVYLSATILYAEKLIPLSDY